MFRTIAVTLIFPIAMPLLAQHEKPAAPAQRSDTPKENAVGAPLPAREPYQGGWERIACLRATEEWRGIAAARPTDANAQWNLFRSERGERLRASNGQLRAEDRNELDSIAQRISACAPGGFEQRMTEYWLRFPDPAAFDAIEKARSLAPDREELIAPMILRAIALGDGEQLDHWCRELEKRGGLAPALSSVARDLLSSVEKDGIVFVNGDMDLLPALVLQRVHNERRDVLVIDRRLLVDAAYRQRLWREAKAGGEVPLSGTDIAVRLHEATTRPIFLALSLDRSWFSQADGKLCCTGLTFKLCDGTTDMALLQKHWSAMCRTPAAGPLSHNYLLPGSLLLEHYRALDDEELTVRTEHELRALADAIGATKELLKTGVLIH